MVTEIRRADITCKIVIIGDSGVGKTSVMRRFTDNEFSYNFIATLGIDFKIKNLIIRGKSVRVQIWDTAGQEKFQSITTGYYRGAKGVMITYDITKKTSFEHISKWITNFKRWSDVNVERMLIGNKSDLEEKREVEMAEGEKVAQDNFMFFCETSAKNNKNINEAFTRLLDTIVAKEIKKQETAQLQKENTVKVEAGSNETNGKTSCCR